MRHTDTIPQVDGATRYLFACPRGTIAIDEYQDGTVELTRCLDGSRLTRRDDADAMRTYRQLTAEVED